MESVGAKPLELLKVIDTATKQIESEVVYRCLYCTPAAASDCPFDLCPISLTRSHRWRAEGCNGT
jgi:hypothetical protein